MIGYESDKKEPSKDGKTIESPITKIMQDVRMPWFCPECKCVMKKRADDRYWRRHKMCLECWSKKETKMKIDGTWDEYQREQDELYRRSYVKDLKAELQGYIDMVSKDQDIAQDSGNLERWGMRDSSEIVETLGKEIKNNISNIILLFICLLFIYSICFYSFSILSIWITLNKCNKLIKRQT